MRTLHEHPKKLMLVAYAIAGGVVLAIAASWGYRGFIDAWKHPHPGWLAVVAGGSIAALVSYLISYRALMHFDGGPQLSLNLAIRIVALGFGPFVPGGGFDVDKRALQAIHGDGPEVGQRIFAIGALELAVLAPIACVAAIILIINGDPKPLDSMLWPWALAVPGGFIFGFWGMGWLRRRVDPSAGGIRGAVGRAVTGAWMLTEFPRHPREGWPAVLGMAAYWAFDVASFYGALRFLGLRASLCETIIAYATGYALTRRSVPLGGAGMTEVFLTFSLHWVGQRVLASLAAVVVYRLFNFVFPAVPALLAHGRMVPLVTAPAGTATAEGAIATQGGVVPEVLPPAEPDGARTR
jgi:uncharacterized membrane protein YbhN (UPF0104 family)